MNAESTRQTMGKLIRNSKIYKEIESEIEQTSNEFGRCITIYIGSVSNNEQEMLISILRDDGFNVDFNSYINTLTIKW